MRIKSGFVLREVGGRTVVVATGKASRSFNGMIRLGNRTAKFIWTRLSEGRDKDEILADMLREYDVDEAAARADLDDFISRLREADVLE